MPTRQWAPQRNARRSKASRVATSRALPYLLALLASSSGAWAGQEQVNEGVAPASAEQASTPLERAFAKVPGGLQLNAITDWTRSQLQDAPAFIRDTQLTLKPRTYFFYEDQTNATQSPTDPSLCISDEDQCTGTADTIAEAWAIGGSLEYKSGWLYDHFRIGAEYFGSWPLYAGPNAGDTRLLTSSGSSYSVLGQAYAQIKYWDQVLTAGRSEYGTPYVNRQFNRMTPNTFEGVSLEGSFTGLRGKHFDYLVGYLSKIKKRNSDEFIPNVASARHCGELLRHVHLAVPVHSLGCLHWLVELLHAAEPEHLLRGGEPGRPRSATSTVSRCRCSIPASGTWAARRPATSSRAYGWLATRARERALAMRGPC